MRADPATYGDPAGSRITREPAPRRRFWQSVGHFLLRWREVSIVVAALLLIIYFQATANQFLSTDNIGNLVDFTATTAIIAAGEVMVLVVGELDLSVGMVYAFAPFVMFFTNAAGVPMWLSVIVALVASAGIGAVNAAITILLDVPAFVTTLGTLFVVNGLTLTISGGFPVQPQAGAVFTAIIGGSVWARFAWAIAHRRRPPVRAAAHPFRPAHHRHRRQSHRCGRGRHQGEEHQGRQLHPVRGARRLCRRHRRLPHRLDRSAGRRLADHVRGHRLGRHRRHAA